MSEKRYYWIKLMKDFFTNPKIKKLRKLAGGAHTELKLKQFNYRRLKMSKKPLIIFIAICWMIAFIGIFLMKDLEYHPMPGQYEILNYKK